ncbi:MAG TPA: hypothetical protein VGN52_05645 [Burkholderiales bacterium]|jgi:flagellar biosynthesis/type III secretory pathway chaperone
MAALQLTSPPRDGFTAQQLALGEQLLQVLEEEFSALQNNDAPALAAIAGAKAGLLKALDPHLPARLAGEARRRFEMLLREAAMRNRRNGEYVAAQHAYVRARWAGLASIAGLTPLYNASGASRTSPSFGSALGRA